MLFRTFKFAVITTNGTSTSLAAFWLVSDAHLHTVWENSTIRAGPKST